MPYYSNSADRSGSSSHHPPRPPPIILPIIIPSFSPAPSHHHPTKHPPAWSLTPEPEPQMMTTLEIGIFE
eukprot:3065848-Pyramimonas_sp.AAC.1